MYEKLIAENFGNLHNKGFNYLARICELYGQSPAVDSVKITNLYRQVASEYGTSYSNVERCTRSYVQEMPDWGLPVRLNKKTIAEVVPAIVHCVKSNNQCVKANMEDIASSLAYEFKCVGCQYEQACHGTCHYEDCVDFQKFNERLLEAFGKLNGGA